jgi:predicted phage tail component-like protein
MSVMYSVKFNDVELGNYIYVLRGFTPFVGASWNPSIVTQYGKINGGKFQYQKYGPKYFTMPFSMEADTEAQLKEKYDSLQRALNVSAPTKLIFEGASDRYCLALPSGELEFDQILATGEGVITWVVPDGVAHATTEKVFEAEVGEDGILKAQIYNSGTEAAAINYKITHAHENGYIGIVSERGAIQLGKVQEADGEDYKQNEMLINGLQTFLSAPDDHETNYMHPDHGTAGTLSSISDDALVLGSIGSGESGQWCGGMRTITLPEDSEGEVGAKNFWCYLNWWFEAGLMGQTAEQSIAFLTADNEVICGYSLFKADMSGNKAYLEFWLNGKVVATKEFISSNNPLENPFDEARGHQDIRKEGDKVTFYWFGSYYPRTDPAIKNMACTKIQVAFTQVNGRNAGNQYVTRNYLRNLRFEKMGVEKWRDVPNRYAAGDVITIDGADTKVYRNGMNITGDEVTGSKYFLAPPGLTEVEFYYSDFCNPPPVIEASIQEVYL